ncbi:hypothetical protein ACFFRR_010336 [Megaselia abdita]
MVSAEIFIFIGGFLLTAAYPQGDFVFASGDFSGFGGPGTRGQNNPIPSNIGNFVDGNSISGFGSNEGRTGNSNNGISSGQFAGFGGPGSQQVQGQNNPITSDNGNFIEGIFVSGFGPNNVPNNGIGRQNRGQNGNLVGGNFGSGFETTTVTPSSTTRTVLTQRYFSCLQQCLSTNEYNPVCGSDGQNYHNAARLGCSQRCGLSEYGFYL